MDTYQFPVSELEMDTFRTSHDVRLINANEDEKRQPSFLEYFCCALYAELFVVGIVSNVVVLRILMTILRNRVSSPQGAMSSGSNNSTLAYLIALCAVNVLVLSALPLTIADVGTGEWRLPHFLCSVYWIAETLNKIMTSVISASFSLSCYFSVCRYNVIHMYKSFLVAALILLAGLSLTCWHASAALSYADVYTIVAFESDNTTENGTLITIKGKKCLFHPNTIDDATTFTISTISCGYAIPALIMLLCYAAILKKVFQQSKSGTARRMSDRFRRTAVSVATLIMFYLCTWTPFWLVTITLNALLRDTDGQRMISNLAVIVHLLPFLNSAFSPLVYVLLNRDIRSKYRSIMNRSGCARKDTNTLLAPVPVVRSLELVTVQNGRQQVQQCARSL